MWFALLSADASACSCGIQCHVPGMAVASPVLDENRERIREELRQAAVVGRAEVLAIGTVRRCQAFDGTITRGQGDGMCIPAGWFHSAAVRLTERGGEVRRLELERFVDLCPCSCDEWPLAVGDTVLLWSVGVLGWGWFPLREPACSALDLADPAIDVGPCFAADSTPVGTWHLAPMPIR